MVVKESTVMLIRRKEKQFTSACIYGSIYVDKWGETDVGFVRGKPLTLSAEKQQHLVSLWLNGSSIHNTVVQHLKWIKL